MSRTIQKLADTIRKKRVDGTSWRVICEQEGIYSSSGKVDPGLAYQISKGFEPKKTETLKRLNLTRRCPTCKRPIKNNKLKHRHNLNDTWKRISDMPTKELLWCLQNRTEMK